MSIFVRSALLLVAVPSFLSTSYAAERSATSPSTQVHLIELYTSEGCSSCPPAESWLRGLRQEAGLGKTFIPIAFHVDYWNYLGWSDRFSRAEFTQRQHSYAEEWRSAQVYTPEFVLDGREWRGRGLPAASSEKPGVLTLTWSENAASVRFKPEQFRDATKVWIATIAPATSTEVKAGENRGRKLEHDFVATDLRSAELQTDKEGHVARFDVPKGSKAGGLVAWVTSARSLAPRQAVAIWFE